LYADTITGSMERALGETNRRRIVQQQYNDTHGTSPQTVQKEVRETIRSYQADAVAEVVAQYSSGTEQEIGKDGSPVRIEDLPLLIDTLERQMKDCAKAMEFEKAAQVRDEIQKLRQLMGTSDGKLGIGAKRKLPGRVRR